MIWPRLTIRSVCALAGFLCGWMILIHAEEPPATIVAFGDSTTAVIGKVTVYATLLEQGFARTPGPQPKVVNAGVRSNTTADAMKRFERDVLGLKPELLIIQFGINDATIDVWKTPPANNPRVSLSDYRSNLRKFVTAARGNGIQVILMTPNPLEWTDQLRELYGRPPYDVSDPDGLNLNLRVYAEAMREVAQDTDTPLVDVMKAHDEFKKHQQGSLLADGIHPNQKGHRLVAELLMDLLDKQGRQFLIRSSKQIDQRIKR